MVIVTEIIRRVHVEKEKASETLYICVEKHVTKKEV